MWKGCACEMGVVNRQFEPQHPGLKKANMWACVAGSVGQLIGWDCTSCVCNLHVKLVREFIRGFTLYVVLLQAYGEESCRLLYIWSEPPHLKVWYSKTNIKGCTEFIIDVHILDKTSHFSYSKDVGMKFGQSSKVKSVHELVKVWRVISSDQFERHLANTKVM